MRSQKLLETYAGDILHSKGMDMEKRFFQHGTVTVFDHSVAVALMCLQLAALLRLRTDTRSLVRGALLHDYFLYDWHIKEKGRPLHGTHHARRAMKNAERDFGLNKIERNMILAHMFPLNLTLPRYRESVLLCTADKLCALRETARGVLHKKNRAALSRPATDTKNRTPLKVQYQGVPCFFGAPRQSKSEPVLFFTASFTSSKVMVLVPPL